MIEYVKKADVLEIINSTLPRDLTFEYIYELKGVWLDEDEADTPQTDCPKMTEEEFDTMLAKVLVGQTESTGSPIGDYRDGVGAWQTDCGWK